MVEGAILLLARRSATGAEGTEGAEGGALGTEIAREACHRLLQAFSIYCIAGFAHDLPRESGPGTGVEQVLGFHEYGIIECIMWGKSSKCGIE